MQAIHHIQDIIHNQPERGEPLILSTEGLSPQHQIIIDGKEICDVYSRGTAHAIARALEGDLATVRQLVADRCRREKDPRLADAMMEVSEFIRKTIEGLAS